MKLFLLLSVLASVLMATAANKCSTNTLNSVVASGGKNDVADLSNYAKLQFQLSYKYLLLSMNFNSFLKDRPGFNKLFRKQSDKLFDDSIALVKHMTTRGYVFDPKANDVVNFSRTLGVALTEQAALAKGLTSHKTLVQKALNICKESDYEIKHYFQDEILEDYVKTLRTFTGYHSNLNNFGKSPNFKLGVYLFDEYLQKQ